MYDVIRKKLARGETIILDGGTGTDIQRRGVPMSSSTWCAEANVSHPEVVRAVHEDYIRAGADVIIANTFATSALLFNALGRDDELLTIDRAAVTIAKEAAKGHQVAVAGSMSTMRPVAPGSDRTLKQREWPEAQARALFRRKADNLAAAGADFIMMEMMRDRDYSVWASEAAMATGLPVWIGISVERHGSRLTGFGREDQPLDDVARTLSGLKPEVISIMHTSPNDTDEAIDILRRHWKGPIGAYPESGYFKMPEWTFVDIIPPEELVKRSKAWKHQGVTAFGGCCGLGPDHIKALSEAFKP
ncbi:homocysteine S-methyltransferase family protein [Aestuariivirga sp.]|jgi:homocysteine S-methyltransferase|uniref:homocysteine S-methyltransferase family protein n=1 Tax=Aestuariivirga sp. TaxID=2650926 RepID=UPI00378400CE